MEDSIRNRAKRAKKKGNQRNRKVPAIQEALAFLEAHTDMLRGNNTVAEISTDLGQSAGAIICLLLHHMYLMEDEDRTVRLTQKGKDKLNT